LRLVFIGTPEFSIPTLDSLIDHGHDVVSVLTKPDRPTGRGRKMGEPPVKTYAKDLNIPVIQPDSIAKDDLAIRHLASLQAEVAVVVAYGALLPRNLLDLFPLGCLNLHPSSLPKYRGPSPVATAILEGNETTGVTIMLLDEGMDSGPILSQEKVAIDPTENCHELTTRLFKIGGPLMAETLSLWKSNGIEAIPQDNSTATFTKPLSRVDGEIDWSMSSAKILRAIKAFHPWPSTYTFIHGKILKIITASDARQLDDISLEPGQMKIDSDVFIRTGTGFLKLHILQLEGRNAAKAHDFIHGQKGLDGTLLGR